MSGDLEVTEGSPYALDFYLDPLETPVELRPETFAALHHDDATLIQGFVVDADAGEPLADVRVASFPSGAATRTDARGFFRFYVPVQSDTVTNQTSASLVFEKAGYGTQERLNLELWPRGDWTYRLRLQRGGFPRSLTRIRSAAARRSQPRGGRAAGSDSPFNRRLACCRVAATGGVVPMSTAASNATVRVPRNIRVLKSDGVTIDYVTMDYYVKHVLPAEWYSSWADSSERGRRSNSLNAGAVAIRCYAITKINSPMSTTYESAGRPPARFTAAPRPETQTRPLTTPPTTCSSTAAG